MTSTRPTRQGKHFGTRKVSRHSAFSLLAVLLTSLPAAASCSAEIRVVETSLDPAMGAEVKLIEAPGSTLRSGVPSKTTNELGIVRFGGLSPKKTPKLIFEIAATGPRSSTVFVDLRKACHGTYKVVLPDKIPSHGNDR